MPLLGGGLESLYISYYNLKKKIVIRGCDGFLFVVMFPLIEN